MGWRTWRLALAVAMAAAGGWGCREKSSATPASESTPDRGPGATGDARASAPAAAARARVVLLGTSLTAGLGLDPAEAYPALLQRKADSAGYAVEVVNAGLSGETSAGALRRAGVGVRVLAAARWWDPSVARPDGARSEVPVAAALPVGLIYTHSVPLEPHAPAG